MFIVEQSGRVNTFTVFSSPAPPNGRPSLGLRFRDLGNDIRAYGCDSRMLEPGLRRFDNDLRRLEPDFRAYGRGLRRFGNDVRRFGNDLHRLGNDFHRLGNDFRRLGHDFQKLKKRGQPTENEQISPENGQKATGRAGFPDSRTSGKPAAWPVPRIAADALDLTSWWAARIRKPSPSREDLNSIATKLRG